MEASASTGSQPGLHRAVARSTMMLVGAQFLTTPISILLNMVMTRRLGAEEFGTLFLAGNLCGLAFLFVDWGQAQSIAGASARNPDAAPRLLGTGLWIKVVASVAAILVLWIVGFLLHYAPQVQLAIALTSLQLGLNLFSANFGAILRGRERLDRFSQLTVLGGVLNFALVVPVLLLGGDLVAVLVSQCIGSAVMLLLYVVVSWRIGIRVGAPDLAMARELMHAGSGFFLLSVVIALQPALDTVLLSKLAPPEVVGWHSAARRFIGFLIFPATTLQYAVYPTLARLARTEYEEFLSLTRASMRAVVIFGVPSGVGCALFAPLVIRIFSGNAYLPAAPVLQVLSIFVFLVYFSIILGSSLAALDRQLPWALVQLACVLISAIGDPLFIPWCQQHFSNGAIGISITSAVSEILMVGGGMWLAPRGLIDRSVLLATGRCLLAGGAMVAVGVLAAPLPWPLVLALSLLAYLGALALVGGLRRGQIQLILDVVRTKTSRFTRPAKPAEPVL